jgi:hypothetical protein
MLAIAKNLITYMITPLPSLVLAVEQSYTSEIHNSCPHYCKLPSPLEKNSNNFLGKEGGWVGIDEEGCSEVISTSSIPTARKKCSPPLLGHSPGTGLSRHV